MIHALVSDKEKTYYERINKRIDLMKEFVDTCDPRIITAAKESLGISNAASRKIENGTIDEDITIDDILKFEVKSLEYEDKFIKECFCKKRL